MSSPHYYNFIADVWKQLSEKDSQRMSELWKGFEQVIAASYQKHIEASFNTSVAKQFQLSDERWLPHEFNADNEVSKNTAYTSSQDLSLGINLSSKYLIKIGWDNSTPIELNIRGADPSLTRLYEIIEKINLSAGFDFASADSTDSLLILTSPTSGVSSKITIYTPSVPSADASEIVLGVLPEECPKTFPEYMYVYSSPYPKLYSVPVLQNAIRDESVTVSLVENLDFKLEGGEFFFKAIPPEYLWAKRNLFNEEWPWNNFGFLLDIYQPNTERYIQVIQGLWFAFWTGPKPDNLRKALYLLFQLPTAPFDGIVTRITSSEIDVTDINGTTQTESIPTDLEPDVVLGQSVEIFHPLVTGISVLDKVNSPGFIENEIGRYGIQRFLLDEASRGTDPGTDESKALRMLEEYTFLPQISVNAFVSPDINISNVRLFLDNIKPVIKTYLFQVIIGTFKDELNLQDRNSWQLDMDVTPNVDSNETTFLPISDLEAHEITPDPGLCVDSEGILLQESVEVEVRSFGALIDLFSV